jgi:hypothetical protein
VLLLSATTLPLVAAMLLMAAIEIVAIDFLTIFFVISDGRSALQLAEGNRHSAIVNALRAAGAH